MILPRFLTMLVGAPLLLVSIWWGQIPFFILVFGIVMLALHEYYTLAEEANWPVSKKAGLLCGALLVFSITFFGTKFDWNTGPARESLLAAKEIYLTPLAISLGFLFLMSAALFSGKKENAFMDVAVTWLGIFYVAWTLAHIFLIRDLRPGGELYTFFLFIVTWTLDVFAYLGGMKFGRNKMSETVSPKKTWEGALVGSLAAVLAALFCRWTFLRSETVLQALCLGILIVVLAQVSDLSESLFKRNVQVKDSGRLLPGHGGILDRFDSFLLTTPIYYYAIVLFVLK